MAPHGRTLFYSDIVHDFANLGGVPEFSQRLLDGLRPIFGDRLVTLREALKRIPRPPEAANHPNYFVREAVVANLVAAARPGGIFFFPNFQSPLDRIPDVHATLNVIHDLQYKFLPQNFARPGTIQGLDKEFSRTARDSDKVLFVSATTQSHFVRHFGHPRSARMIHAPIQFAEPDGEAANRAADDPPFLLSSCHLTDQHRHKNFPGVLKLFEGLAPRIEGLRLHLTGRGGPAFEARLAALPSALRERIVPLGFVSREELDAQYRRALAYVSLSFFEGFNMSAGEAACHRTPMILSHLPVHRELFSHGAGARTACFVDPRDPSIDAVADWLARFPLAERAAPWPLAASCQPAAFAARVAAEIDALDV